MRTHEWIIETLDSDQEITAIDHAEDAADITEDAIRGWTAGTTEIALVVRTIETLEPERRLENVWNTDEVGRSYHYLTAHGLGRNATIPYRYRAQADSILRRASLGA